MNKRGISAIVAVVLTILITIVGIMILWLAILPNIELDAVVSEESILNTRLDILTENGYTVYDEADHFAFVQVKRGVDDSNVGSLEISFNIDGNTVTYRTDHTPEANGMYTYSFNFTRDGVVGVPDTASVAPVFVRGTSERVGDITSTVNMPVKPALIGWEDNYGSMGNVPSNDDTGGGAGPGDEEFNEPCYDGDGDGYGVPASTGCSGGAVSDCDDTEYRINPGMLERCGNCISDNCNGDVDFADPDCNRDMFSTNLVSRWKFDTATQGLDNLSRNHATVYGGANVTYDPGVMCVGESINFGGGGYAIVDNSSDDCDLNMNNESGTISVWFKRNDYQIGYDHLNYILSMFDWIAPASSITTMNSRMYIYFNETTDDIGIAMGRDPGPSWQSNIASAPLGEWHFATMTWNINSSLPDATGNHSFYLDGRKVGTYPFGNYDGFPQRLIWGTWRDNAACNNVGHTAEYEEYFDGRLDDARMFNRSLNDTEVMELYNWY